MTAVASALCRGDAGATKRLLRSEGKTRRHRIAICDDLHDALRDLWNDDHISDTEITIALSYLLTAFRDISQEARPLPSKARASPIIVASCPKEPHFHSAPMLSEFIRENGFSNKLILSHTREELIDQLDGSNAVTVVLTLSPIFQRVERAEYLSTLIKRIRKRIHPASRFVILGRLSKAERSKLKPLNADAFCFSMIELMALLDTLGRGRPPKIAARSPAPIDDQPRLS